MDKRWLGILLILVAGLSCMYIIVDNSDTVGNAITVISDVAVPVPSGFKIAETTSMETKLVSESGDEEILITCIKDDLDPLKEFSKRLYSFQKDKDIEIIKNKTNKTIQEIELKDLNSGENTTFVLFEKENHSFIMKMKNFDNEQEKQKTMMHIIDNIVHDYKQNK